MKSDAVYGTFDDFLADVEAELRPICISLGRLAKSAHKGALEIVWIGYEISSYGVGPKKMTEHYAYLSAHRTHVNLGFYHGARLPDPSGVLEGSGKSMRHVKIRSIAETRAPALKALLRAAVDDRLEANKA